VSTKSKSAREAHQLLPSFSTGDTLEKPWQEEKIEGYQQGFCSNTHTQLRHGTHEETRTIVQIASFSPK